MEIIFELLAELLLQLFGELLLEIGLHALVEPFRKQPHPWLSAFAYTVFGAAAGGLTLLFVPAHFVHALPLRLLNLLLTPLAAGLLMAQVGAWRQRRGQELLRLDHFGYGFLFAFSLALVRFFFAA